MSALSLEFETDLRNIYSRSRTLDEVTREIAALRDKIAERRDAYEKEYDRTSQIIESRFDEDVRKVFKRLREELPHGLAELDRDVADLVDGYLASRGVKYRRSEKAGRVVFEVASGACTARGDRRRAAIRNRRRRGLDRRRGIESRASAGSCGDRGRSRVAGRFGRAAAAVRSFYRPRCAGRTRRRHARCSGRLRRLRAGSTTGCRGCRRRHSDRSIAGRQDPAVAGDRRSGIRPNR